MCLYVKIHQKVEGMGLKIIHRLGVDECYDVALLYNQDLWITSNHNKLIILRATARERPLLR